MPSLSESRKQVEESLRADRSYIDHDDVLASLQDEIDKHNGVKEDLKRSMNSSSRDEARRSQHRPSKSSRFRFKDGAGAWEARTKRRSTRRNDDDSHHRSKRKRHYPTPPDGENTEGTHPFPREPTDPSRRDHKTDDAAFRDSLFDALADDEGAAYWESVYSQPIHVYQRPTVQTEKGKLEQMSDEDYTAYVKTKMWEKKHPEMVLEREQSERRRREEEEEKTRKKEEFVRRKEQAAWDQAQKGAYSNLSDDEDDRWRRYKFDDEDEGRKRYKYEFAGEKKWSSSAPSGKRAQKQDYREAWSRYLTAWGKLKHELLNERQNAAEASKPTRKPSQRIPWPVFASKPVIKANIEDFMRHAPTDEQRPVMQMLKAERVRWHPDKVQQRFGGEVDEGTMKVVTGVFQVVDGLLEEERKKGEGS